MAENDFQGKQATAARWVRFSEQLSTLSRLVRAGLTERLESRALGWSQFSLLWVCHEWASVGLSQNELSGLLGVSSAHVSGLVEQLRSKGLLVGHRAASDRRRQVWRLTDEGRALLGEVLADLVDWVDDLERRLGVDDAQWLEQVVQRLIFRVPSERGDVVNVAPRKGAA